tara:strand:+ start:21 stop:284 length:264 start_codon:yes stop_codon:yes gene_type:complete
VGSLAPAIPQSNDWCFDAFCHLDNFGDFLGVHFAHATAMDAEVLGEAVHPSSIDGAVASNDAITDGMVQKHAIVCRSMSDKGINLNE